MPIALSCGCGKTLRVKDELAGRRVRCPGCSTIVAVPVPEEPIILDEIPEAQPFHPGQASPPPNIRPGVPKPPPNIWPGQQGAAPHVRPGAPTPQQKGPVRPAYEEEPEDVPVRKKRKKPRKKKSSNYDEDRGSSGMGVAVHPSIIAGILMMVGAVAWFVIGLANNIIFFYPPVLFILGIGAIVKGFMGTE